jgi:Flp pilus assembly protein TadD
MVAVTLPKERTELADEALKWYQNGVRQGQRDDYKRAVRLLERVLERPPSHIEARRNLAMSHLERGDKEEAKRRLIEVLKLDPKDAWSYVLLGDICSKQEKAFDRAEG